MHVRLLHTSVPKLSFGLGVRGENYPPKRDKESAELLVGLDPKKSEKGPIACIFNLGCRVYNVKRSIHTTAFSTYKFQVFLVGSGNWLLKIGGESGKLIIFGCRFPPKSTNFGTLHWWDSFCRNLRQNEFTALGEIGPWNDRCLARVHAQLTVTHGNTASMHSKFQRNRPSNYRVIVLVT